jgi:hypothetical protein
LGDEEGAAEGFDRGAVLVDPGQDLAAKAEVRADGPTEPEGNGGAVEHVAVSGTGPEIIRLAARAETKAKPEPMTSAFANLDQALGCFLSYCIDWE